MFFLIDLCYTFNVNRDRIDINFFGTASLEGFLRETFREVAERHHYHHHHNHRHHNHHHEKKKDESPGDSLGPDTAEVGNAGRNFIKCKNYTTTFEYPTNVEGQRKRVRFTLTCIQQTTEIFTTQNNTTEVFKDEQEDSGKESTTEELNTTTVSPEPELKIEDIFDISPSTTPKTYYYAGEEYGLDVRFGGLDD